ncbi:hypothetical protein ACLD1M_18985, partial [Acinetobacter baumannii]
SVICGPIGCAVDFLCRLLHLKIILLKKPLRTALCNKADIYEKALYRKIFIVKFVLNIILLIYLEKLNYL